VTAPKPDLTALHLFGQAALDDALAVYDGSGRLLHWGDRPGCHTLIRVLGIPFRYAELPADITEPPDTLAELQRRVAASALDNARAELEAAERRAAEAKRLVAELAEAMRLHGEAE
jgi:hypothetical protein